LPIRRADDAAIDAAAALLRSGGIVAFPTETVYGLGANAFDAIAVARVFEAKARPAFDPLIVHIADNSMLHEVAAEVPVDAQRLIDAFWPGPLTIVLTRSARVPRIVTSGLDTVAVRMPAHPIARDIVARAGIPVAAPSANPFGYLSPTRAEHVERMLGERVDLIVDGGATNYGVESTIVMLSPRPSLLRHGAIPVEAIESLAGPLERAVTARERAALSPGTLVHHYASRTPIRVIDPAQVPEGERHAAALLALTPPETESSAGYAELRVLSKSGDLGEAAAHLFELLHELDASGVVRIDVEPIPERGIGAAIADRLRRAAASI
jgi:L-threonylcarbamoyladenylate synthase